MDKKAADLESGGQSGYSYPQPASNPAYNTSNYVSAFTQPTAPPPVGFGTINESNMPISQTTNPPPYGYAQNPNPGATSGYAPPPGYATTQPQGYNPTQPAGYNTTNYGFPPNNPSPTRVVSKKSKCCYYFRGVLSGIAHVGFYGGLISLIVGAVLGNRIAMIVGGSLMGSFLVVALIESACSNTRQYMHNFMSATNFGSLLQTIKSNRPEVKWKVECYHWETRYRTVVSRDGEGNTSVRTESYQVRVTTHTDSRVYEFSRWLDASAQQVSVTSSRVTRVEIEKSLSFMNSQSEADYNARKEQFRLENVNRDRCMDFKEDIHIDGFKERVTVFGNEASRDCCMRESCFWVTSATMTNPCFRCWFNSSSSKVEYKIVKQIGI